MFGAPFSRPSWTGVPPAKGALAEFYGMERTLLFCLACTAMLGAAPPLRLLFRAWFR